MSFRNKHHRFYVVCLMSIYFVFKQRKEEWLALHTIVEYKTHIICEPGLTFQKFIKLLSYLLKISGFSNCLCWTQQAAYKRRIILFEHLTIQNHNLRFKSTNCYSSTRVQYCGQMCYLTISRVDLIISAILYMIAKVTVRSH